MNFFDIYGIVFITDRNKKKEIADGYKKFAWFRSGDNVVNLAST